MHSDFLVNPEDVKKYVRGGGPIVVVDDDPDQHMIVERCYKKSIKNNKLVFLKDGNELIELLRSVLNNRQPMPELILLDINMPQTDGFQALEEIKSHEEFQRIPVIIMLTTSDSARDIAKAKDLGADAYWSKPASIKDYVEFFNRV